MNTLKGLRANRNAMVAVPTKPSFQWGNREVVNEEYRWRARRNSSRDTLTWVVFVLAVSLTVFVVCLIIDFLG